MDLVKITNTGDTPVEFFGNEVVVLPPGKSKIVTWEFACNWLGRPDIEDKKERANAFDLVRLTWGYMQGLHTDDTWVNGGGVEPMTGQPMHSLPKIKVESLSDPPAPITMLIEDPHRLAAFAGLSADDLPVDTSDVTLLRAHLARQAEEMESLKALIAGLVTNPTPELLDPASATALSTVDAAASGKSAPSELPTPKATKKGATDGPLTVS